MVFTANRTELLAIARTVLKSVPQSIAVDVLKGILVEADAEQFEVSLTATNYETAVQCKLPAAVEAGGSAVLDAKMLTGILSLLGEEDVSFRLHSNQLCEIKSGRAVYQIASKPGKDYPKPEIPLPENTVSLTNIQSIAKSTVYVAAKGEDKPILSGIRVDIDAGRLRACGCDGHRLAEYTREIKTAGKLRFLMPAHSLNMLSSMVRDGDTLEVGVAGSSLVFTKYTIASKVPSAGAHNFLFSARTIPGEYIDVDAALASFQPAYRATVDTAVLAAALDMLSTVNGSGGKVDMTFAENKITLSSEGEQGRSETSLEAECTTPTQDSFRYELSYLHEFLRRFHGKAEILLSAVGMFLVQSETETYFQISMQKTTKKAKAA